MDKDDTVHIHNVISAIKMNELVVVRYVNLEPVKQSEVSQKEISYINANVWNLEK